MPASTAITLALVFYTIGVFGERRAGTLKKSHLALFWLGLICDTTGTTIMTTIARTSAAAVSPLHAIPYCAGLFIGIPVFHFGDAAVLAFSVCIPALIGIVLFAQERKRAC